MSLYSNIIKQAWSITWHNKFLWIWGFFASILGAGGAYEALFKASNQLNEKVPTISSTLNQIFQLENIKRYYQTLKIFFREDWQYFIISLLIGLAILIIFLLLIWLAVISVVGLIDGYKKISRKETSSLSEGFSLGNKYFWPILGLFFIAKVVILFLLFLISWLMAFSIDSALKIFIVFILFAIFIFLSLVIYFVIIYAVAYIILKGKGFWPAIKESISLFFKYWLISIEMAIMLFLIGLAVGIAFILSTIIIGVPIFLLVMIFSFLKWILAINLILLLGIFIAVLLLIFFSSFFTAFQYGCWTLLFIRLTEKGGVSKLIRLFKKT